MGGRAYLFIPHTFSRLSALLCESGEEHTALLLEGGDGEVPGHEVEEVGGDAGLYLMEKVGGWVGG